MYTSNIYSDLMCNKNISGNVEKREEKLKIDTKTTEFPPASSVALRTNKCETSKNIQTNDHRSSAISMDRAKKRKSNLFQRFIAQRRSLNLSISRHGPYPKINEPPNTNSIETIKKKIKLLYMKKMGKCEMKNNLRKTKSEPDMLSANEWKNVTFPMLENSKTFRLNWSFDDVNDLKSMPLMSSSNDLENISDNSLPPVKNQQQKPFNDRKRSSSFRILKRNNSADVVKTWVYRRRCLSQYLYNFIYHSALAVTNLYCYGFLLHFCCLPIPKIAFEQCSERVMKGSSSNTFIL